MFNRLQSRRASSSLDMPRRKFAGFQPARGAKSQDPFSREQFAEIICDRLEDDNENVHYFVGREPNGIHLQIMGNSDYDGSEWTITLSSNKLSIEVIYVYELPNGTQKQYKDLILIDNMFNDEIDSLGEEMNRILKSLIEGYY
jgi:hypothetical protein